MNSNRFSAFAGAWALAVLVSSCGGSNSPTSPSTGNGGSSGSGGTVGATITITSAGVSPKTVTITAGSRVTFVNNDSRPHDMNSNPHPEHTDCPALNVGFISAGASGTSQNLTTVRSCGYHDHNQPDVVALQGTVIIQ